MRERHIFSIAIILLSSTIVVFANQSSVGLKEEISIPNNFEILSNGKEDYFYSSFQVLNTNGEDIYKDWNSLTMTQKTEFEKHKENSIKSLYDTYADSEKNNSDIGDITLDFFVYIDKFESNLIKPIVAENNSMVYTVPELKNQYFTYMPIRTITSKSSSQYRFKKYQTTDERGYRRYGEAYCIALGTYYGTDIGTVYEITFSDNSTIKGVLTDVKSDLHTDPTHRYAEASLIFDGSKGNVLEFVMDDEISSLNNLSSSERERKISKIILEDFKYDVKSIKKVGKVDVRI